MQSLHGSQDHETFDSSEPRMMNVSTNSFCVLGLHLAKGHDMVSLVPLSPFCSEEDSLGLVLVAS